MSLFKNAKRPCPICGGATPRLFSAKIEDQPLCRDCETRLCVPLELFDTMSIQDVNDYFAWRDGNDAEKERFIQSCKLEAGDCEVAFDEAGKTFLFDESTYGLLFHASEVVSIEMKEDDAVIFKGGPDICQWRNSGIRERVLERSAAINLSNMMDEAQRRNNRQNATDTRFDDPMYNWHIIITLDHPYWKTLESEVDGPYWNNSTPDCDSFIHDYDKSIEELKELAKTMMQMWFPEALSKPQAAAKTAPAAMMDVAGEIKKFKELLDCGALTQEEFDQKKKQLLGL